MPVRLLYLITIRVFGWLVLLGRSQASEEIGNLPQQVIALRGVAGARRGSGRYRDAMDSYQTALGLARQIGDPYEEAKILEGIAETTLGTRRPDAARIVFRQALDIFERLGVPEAESVRMRVEAMARIP